MHIKIESNTDVIQTITDYICTSTESRNPTGILQKLYRLYILLNTDSIILDAVLVYYKYTGTERSTDIYFIQC